MPSWGRLTAPEIPEPILALAPPSIDSRCCAESYRTVRPLAVMATPYRLNEPVTPMFTLEEGLERTIKWYREHTPCLEQAA